MLRVGRLFALVLFASLVLVAVGCGDDAAPAAPTDGALPDGGGRDGMVIRIDGSPEGDGDIGPDGTMPPVDSGPAVCGDGRQTAGEECDDGNTRDGDGCSSTCTSEGTCEAPLDLATFGMTHPDGSLSLAGTNLGGSLSEYGSCAGDGPHIVVSYAAPGDGLLTLSTHSSITTFDTVLYVRTACDDASTELACNDDSLDTLESYITVPVSAGTTYYIFVDSYDSGGSFELTARMIPTRGAGEACDPASVLDRCAAGLLCADDGAGGTTCQALDRGCGVGVAPVDLTPLLSMGQALYSGSTVGEEAYHQGTCAIVSGTAPEMVHSLTLPYRADVSAYVDVGWNAVVYARMSCSDPTSERACGAGYIDYPELPGINAGETVYFYVDGESSEFGAYSLYVLLQRIAGSGEDCSGVTGDVRCDDGLVCRREATTALCRPTICGDGIVEGSETCDDLNTFDGDGCSSSCIFEDPGPGGEDCFGAVPLTLAATGFGSLGAAATGDTRGAGADLTPTCSSFPTAADLVYSLTMTTPGDIYAEVDPDPGFNAAIHIDGGLGLTCGDPMGELACSDFGLSGDGESAYLFAVMPGTYFIVVDGSGFDPLYSEGPYTLHVTVTPRP